jgi:hypothetical protein
LCLRIVLVAEYRAEAKAEAKAKAEASPAVEAARQRQVSMTRLSSRNPNPASAAR